MGNTTSNTNASNTGNNSVVTSTTTVTNNQSSTVTQNGSSTTNISISANSGGNTTTNNTTASGNGSGNISVNGSVNSQVNSSTQSIVNQAGGNTTTSTVNANNTGEGSVINSSTSASNTVNSSLTQNGSVENNLDVNANTGDNTVSGNTTFSGGPNGDITIGFNIQSSVNGSTIGETGGGGGGGGGVGGGTTGDGSTGFNGVGGDFIPFPEETTLADQPRFFSAGASVLLAQGGAVLLLTFLAVVVARVHKKFSRFLRLGGTAVLALLLVFLPAVPHSFAAEGSDTPVAAQIGPQGPIGPQGLVGPQGPVGPQEPTGPQGCVGPACPVVTASATSASVVSDTGAQAVADSATTTDTDTSLTTTKTADIENTVNANLVSGNNHDEGNTQTGMMNTGDITGIVTIINTANSQFAPGSSVGTSTVNAGGANTVTLTPPTVQNSLSAQNTGSGSSTSNVLQGTNTLNVVGTNTANVDNTVHLTADSGHNTSDNNSVTGGITTGDITIILNELNLMNVVMPNVQLNVNVWNVLLTNPNVTINLGATGTGPGSTVSNNAAATTNRNIQVTNLATLGNDFTVHANTGDNTSTGNTVDNGTVSGNVDIDGRVVTVANLDTIPTLYVVNTAGGQWNGQLTGIPANAVIVDQSGNTLGVGSALLSNTALTNTENYLYSNDATNQNTTVLDLNTGDNARLNNTQGGSTHTGNITVRASFVNLANILTDAYGQFTIGFINLLFSPPSSSQSPTPPSTETVVTSGQPDGTTTIDVSNPSQPTVTVTSQEGNVLATAAFPTPVSSPAPKDESPRLPLDVPVLARKLVEPVQAATKHSPSTQPTGKGVPFGIILLGIFAGGWILIELLAQIEKRREQD